MRHTKEYEMQFSPNLRGVDISDAYTGSVLMRCRWVNSFIGNFMPMRASDAHFYCPHVSNEIIFISTENYLQ